MPAFHGTFPNAPRTGPMRTLKATRTSVFGRHFFAFSALQSAPAQNMIQNHSVIMPRSVSSEEVELAGDLFTFLCGVSTKTRLQFCKAVFVGLPRPLFEGCRFRENASNTEHIEVRMLWSSTRFSSFSMKKVSISESGANINSKTSSSLMKGLTSLIS